MFKVEFKDDKAFLIDIEDGTTKLMSGSIDKAFTSLTKKEITDEDVMRVSTSLVSHANPKMKHFFNYSNRFGGNDFQVHKYIVLKSFGSDIKFEVFNHVNSGNYITIIEAFYAVREHNTEFLDDLCRQVI